MALRTFATSALWLEVAIHVSGDCFTPFCIIFFHGTCSSVRNDRKRSIKKMPDTLAAADICFRFVRIMNDRAWHDPATPFYHTVLFDHQHSPCFTPVAGCEAIKIDP